MTFDNLNVSTQTKKTRTITQHFSFGMNKNKMCANYINQLVLNNNKDTHCTMKIFLLAEVPNQTFH